MAKNAAGRLRRRPPRGPDRSVHPRAHASGGDRARLEVMDTTALSLCMDNRLPIYVFELAEGNIRRVAAGERAGTIISTPATA